VKKSGGGKGGKRSKEGRMDGSNHHTKKDHMKEKEEVKEG
jgi:hypothetical protein